MKKRNWSILKYAVPILAVLVIAIQFLIVNKTNLTKWKGGGFGMYTEVHCYYNEIYIKNLDNKLDSIRSIDFQLDKAIKRTKCLPNTSNLREIATLASKYLSTDTITIQVWKPLVNAKNATYSRELLNEFQLIKP